MTIIHTRKVTKVERHDPYSNMWDVYMIGGSLGFEQVVKDVEAHTRYIGGGYSVATVKVPMRKLGDEVFPSLKKSQMDGIARRIDGRFRISSSVITEPDENGISYLVRSYRLDAN